MLDKKKRRVKKMLGISRIGFSTTIDPEINRAERKVQINNALNAGCVAAGIGTAALTAAYVHKKATTQDTKLNKLVTGMKASLSKLVPESLAKKFTSMKESVVNSEVAQQAGKAKSEVIELGKKAADGITSRLPKLNGKLKTAALVALAAAGVGFIFKSGELHQKAKQA
jgi:hypothetical protein